MTEFLGTTFDIGTVFLIGDTVFLKRFDLDRKYELDKRETSLVTEYCFENSYNVKNVDALMENCATELSKIGTDGNQTVFYPLCLLTEKYKIPKTTKSHTKSPLKCFMFTKIK